MRIMSLFCYVIILFLLIPSVSAYQISEKFIGKWHLNVVKHKNFPWWQELGYPVALVVNAQGGGFFIDQAGLKCVIKQYLYDAEMEALIIPHCKQTHSNGMVSPHYIIRVKGNMLHGEVVTYKQHFSLSGVKIQ